MIRTIIDDAKATENGAIVADKDSQTGYEKFVKDTMHFSAANGKLHASCNFVMKRFEIRQSSCDGEIQVLQQAIAILTGAMFDDA